MGRIPYQPGMQRVESGAGPKPALSKRVLLGGTQVPPEPDVNIVNIDWLCPTLPG